MAIDPDDDSYEAYFRAQLPPYLAGPWGQAFAGAVGYVVDKAVDAAKDATRAGMVWLAPVDALQHIARSRMLEPYDGESDEAYRIRIANAWNDWAAAGPPTELARILQEHMGVSPGQVHVYTPTFDGWHTDGTGENDNWSRYWVVVTPQTKWARPVVGSGLTVGPGLMVGITMRPEELSRIRRIAARWAPGHMWGAELLVSFGGDDPVDILADVNNLNGVRIALQFPMVGYASSAMAVGPSLVVGQEYV